MCLYALKTLCINNAVITIEKRVRRIEYRQVEFLYRPPKVFVYFTHLSQLFIAELSFITGPKVNLMNIYNLIMYTACLVISSGLSSQIGMIPFIQNFKSNFFIMQIGKIADIFRKKKNL